MPCWWDAYLWQPSPRVTGVWGWRVPKRFMACACGCARGAEGGTSYLIFCRTNRWATPRSTCPRPTSSSRSPPSSAPGACGEGRTSEREEEEEEEPDWPAVVCVLHPCAQSSRASMPHMEWDRPTAIASPCSGGRRPSGWGASCGRSRRRTKASTPSSTRSSAPTRWSVAVCMGLTRGKGGVPCLKFLACPGQKKGPNSNQTLQHHPQEMRYSTKRQQYLVDQGYTYKVRAACLCVAHNHHRTFPPQTALRCWPPPSRQPKRNE